MIILMHAQYFDLVVIRIRKVGMNTVSGHYLIETHIMRPSARRAYGGPPEAFKKVLNYL